MTCTLRSLLASAGLATLLIGGAQAQSLKAPASFGEVSLSAGFSPDPHVRRLTAGGAIRAQDRFTDCRGYIANAPDYRLNYSAGSLPLYINVDSNSDTTLVVNGPDGRWYCDDDGADEPLNPLLYWSNPQSGRYDIWVGTYSQGSGAPATLFISELGEQTSSGAGISNAGSGVNIGATARNGSYTINGGFLPDPWARSVTAGGSLQASSAISSDCRGYITSEPTVEINYTGSGNLYIYTSGGSDTTLAINRPDGRWVCNDDGADGLNAGLSFSGNSGGIYDVYVGTYGGGTTGTTLNVSEIEMGY